MEENAAYFRQKFVLNSGQHAYIDPNNLLDDYHGDNLAMMAPLYARGIIDASSANMFFNMHVDQFMAGSFDTTSGVPIVSEHIPNMKFSRHYELLIQVVASFRLCCLGRDVEVYAFTYLVNLITDFLCLQSMAILKVLAVRGRAELDDDDHTAIIKSIQYNAFAVSCFPVGLQRLVKAIVDHFVHGVPVSKITTYFQNVRGSSFRYSSSFAPESVFGLMWSSKFQRSLPRFKTLERRVSRILKNDSLSANVVPPCEPKLNYAFHPSRSGASNCRDTQALFFVGVIHGHECRFKDYCVVGVDMSLENECAISYNIPKLQDCAWISPSQDFVTVYTDKSIYAYSMQGMLFRENSRKRIDVALFRDDQYLCVLNRFMNAARTVDIDISRNWAYGEPFSWLRLGQSSLIDGTGSMRSHWNSFLYSNPRVDYVEAVMYKCMELYSRIDIPFPTCLIRGCRSIWMQNLILFRYYSQFRPNNERLMIGQVINGAMTNEFVDYTAFREALNQLTNLVESQVSRNQDPNKVFTVSLFIINFCILKHFRLLRTSCNRYSRIKIFK